MNTPSQRNTVSAQEWQVRCDLAALYRLLAHFRMTDLIYTHISARLPGGNDTFLINRYGAHFHKMRASDLVRIDVDGNILGADAGTRGNQGDLCLFLGCLPVRMGQENHLFYIRTFVRI